MLLSEKTISAFPLSIGTSLSLESVFAGRLAPYDPARTIPSHVNINDYTEIWFNLATLFRNLIGALPSDAIFSITPEAFAVELLEELEIIDSIFKNEGHGICRPFYYICSYTKVANEYTHKKIRFRESTTDKQKLFDDKYKRTVKAILAMQPTILKQLNSTIKPETTQAKGLIVTHIPYDLVSHTKFAKLDLLESHTGKLKSKYEFSSKYHPIGEDKLDFLPFSEKLLMLFGDKVFIHPFDIRVRKMVLDIARNRDWTPYTTEAKVNYFIENDITEPYLRNWLLSL